MKLGWARMMGVVLAMPASQAEMDPLFPHATVQRYEVTGGNIRQLQRALQSNGPRDDDGRVVQGLTRWQIEWSFDVAGQEGTCKVIDVRVVLRATVTLPHWTPRAGTSPEVVEAWTRYLDALRRHEAVHHRHGAKAADEIRALAATVPPGDCGAVERTFNIKAMRVMDKYRTLSRSYDDRTRHGARQGAVLHDAPAR